MLELKSNVIESALQIEMIAVKVPFKVSSPVKAKVIILPHDTEMSTQLMRNK